MRPKIGRPPASVLPLKAEELQSAPKPVQKPVNLRIAALTVAVALAMSLGLSHFMQTEQNTPPIPPLVETLPAMREPAFAGALIQVGPAEPAISYHADARKPMIDNQARERLRSILSKD